MVDIIRTCIVLVKMLSWTEFFVWKNGDETLNYVYYNGAGGYFTTVAVRPAVVLSSNTIVEEGADGTYTNPYKVIENN